MDSIVQCQFGLAQPFCSSVEMAEALGQVVGNRWLSNQATIRHVWTRLHRHQHHHRPQHLVLRLGVLILRAPEVVAVATRTMELMEMEMAAQGKLSTKSIVILFDISFS